MDNEELLNKILQLEDSLTIAKVEIEDVKKYTEYIKDNLETQIKYSEYIVETLDSTITIVDALIGILNLKDTDDSVLKIANILRDKDKEYFNQLIKKNLRKRKIDNFLSEI
jgi:hypothetical protein